MDFTAWLLKWTPGDLTLTAIFFVALVFLMLRVWPWFVKDYFPARREDERKRMEFDQQARLNDQSFMRDLAETMVEIKTLVQQMQNDNVKLLNVVLERIPIAPQVTTTTRRNKRTVADEKQQAA